MNATVVVLMSSICTQFAAAYFSLKMISKTSSRRAWTALSVAFCLMALRRCLTLFDVTFLNPSRSVDMTAEGVAFITSLLILMGIWWIGPLFSAIKHSEESLQDANRLLETIFSNVHIMIACLDRDFNFIKVNRAYAEADDRYPDFFIHKNHFALYPNEENEAIFRKVVETGEPYQVYAKPFVYAKHPERGTTYWDWSLLPVKDKKGKVTGLIFCLLDVTQRIETEAKLKEKQQMIEAVVEMAPYLVLLSSPDEGLVLMNRTCETLTGYSRNEIVGQSLAESSPFHQYALNVQNRLNNWDPESICLLWQEPWKTKTGEQRFIQWRCTQLHLPDKETPYVLGMGIDITRQKEVEKERGRLAMAIAHIAEGVAIVDSDSVIQYVNPSFEKMSEFAAHEILGCHPCKFKSEDSKKAFCRMIEACIKDGTTKSGYFRARKKDGSHYEIMASISPFVDETGALTHCVILERDVTKEVMLEKQIRQTQKTEALGTLAGGIAHDFNNILGIILSYTELSLMKTSKVDPVSEYLESIRTAAIRAKEVVRQILAISRQRDQKPSPVQFGLIVKEALKLLRASIPKTIEIREQIDTKTIVLADPGQMHQIVVNLCTNAAQAMNERRGVLEVRLERIDSAGKDSSAHQAGLSSGSYLRLTVSDTGRGMQPDIMERVFDPYFTTKAPGEGSGLGLAVVHGIVEKHGGAVTVTSDPGRGSSFYVFLPVWDKGGETEKELAMSTIPGGNENILLVDDEPDLVRVGKEMLEQIGYKVTAKSSSLDAYDTFMAQPGRFDLVITDQIMPNLTGLELAKEILRIDPDVPIILCSGFSDSLTPERARLAGIREFVMKPLILDDLSRLVRKVLDDQELGLRLKA